MAVGAVILPEYALRIPVNDLLATVDTNAFESSALHVVRHAVDAVTMPVRDRSNLGHADICGRQRPTGTMTALG